MSRDVTGLNRYLKDLTGDGALDSSGSFTLSEERLKAKLRRFQLASHADYLVKLVQAGVAASSKAVHVRIYGNSVVVDYDHPEIGAFGSLEQLFQGLGNPLGQKGALRELCVGINASLLGHWKTTFVLNHTDQAVLVKVDGQSGAQARRVNNPPVPRGVCRFALTKSTGETIVWGRVEEHFKLYERCGWSSVPITLDQRPLRGEWKCPVRAGWCSPWSLPFVLLDYYFLEDDGLLVQTPDENVYRREGLGFIWQGSLRTRKAGYLTRWPLAPPLPITVAFSGPTEPVSRVGMAFRLPPTFTGKTKIHLVHNGIRLEPVLDDMNLPGADVIVKADHIETDLTGFQVRLDEKLEAVIEAIYERVPEVLRRAWQAVDHVLPTRMIPLSGVGPDHLRKGLRNRLYPLLDAHGVKA